MTSIRNTRQPPPAPSSKLVGILEAGQRVLDDLGPKLKEHPGELESLIPVWGAGREAVADFHDGDYLGAVGNGALAIADLGGATGLVRAGVKGAIVRSLPKPKRGAKSTYAWDRMRADMGSDNKFPKLLEYKQHGHHWLIPHKEGWGKHVPDVIKNQPWNITPMPSAEIHGRIHGRYKGKARFNPAERIWHGTPGWSKRAAGSATAHVTSMAKAGMERDDD